MQAVFPTLFSLYTLIQYARSKYKCTATVINSPLGQGL